MQEEEIVTITSGFYPDKKLYINNKDRESLSKARIYFSDRVICLSEEHSELSSMVCVLDNLSLKEDGHVYIHTKRYVKYSIIKNTAHVSGQIFFIVKRILESKTDLYDRPRLDIRILPADKESDW